MEGGVFGLYKKIKFEKRLPFSFYYTNAIHDFLTLFCSQIGTAFSAFGSHSHE